MPESLRDVHELHKTAEDTRRLLIDEQEAILGYDKAIDSAEDDKTKEVLEHIKSEEENHVGMLSELLDGQSPPTQVLEEEGKAEAEDILDKMVTDMTSEQAWQDFKSQYIGKSANDTTLDAKLDTVMSAVQEMKVDMDRISDTVPQLQGEIAEQETIENEQEDDGQIDEFGDDVTDELQDGAPIDENGQPMEGEESEEDDDNFFDSLFAGDSEEETPEGQSEDSIEESEAPDEDGSEETDTQDEAESEDDYTPIDEILSEDEDAEEDAESDDAIEDTDDSEDTEDEGEDAVEESEEESEEDDEEILEKMIRILKSQDRRISALERENMALRKAISENTVKTTQVRKTRVSRPAPPIRKMVSGSVSRPPIGISYSANGNSYESEEAVTKGLSAPEFGKASPQEVLAYCNLRANNGM